MQIELTSINLSTPVNIGGRNYTEIKADNSLRLVYNSDLGPVVIVYAMNSAYLIPLNHLTRAMAATVDVEPAKPQEPSPTQEASPTPILGPSTTDADDPVEASFTGKRRGRRKG